jgi:hypothetical protein
MPATRRPARAGRPAAAEHASVRTSVRRVQHPATTAAARRAGRSNTARMGLAFRGIFASRRVTAASVTSAWGKPAAASCAPRGKSAAAAPASPALLANAAARRCAEVPAAGQTSLAARGGPTAATSRANPVGAPPARDSLHAIAEACSGTQVRSGGPFPCPEPGSGMRG